MSFNPIQLYIQSWSSDMILVIVVGFFCLATILTLYFNQRRIRAIQQKLSSLERDLRVAHGSAISMGQQIIALEKLIMRDQASISRRASLPKVSQSAHLAQNQLVDENSKATAVAIELEKKINAAVTDKEFPGSQECTAEGLPEISVYDEARRYLARGQSISEVAISCGLSHAEVSLLSALSKQSTAPS